MLILMKVFNSSVENRVEMARYKSKIACAESTFYSLHKCCAVVLSAIKSSQKNSMKNSLSRIQIRFWEISDGLNINEAKGI